MNKPMTDERLDELVGMVEREDWGSLNENWLDAKTPFQFLGSDSEDCGCPSMVRHSAEEADLTDEQVESLRSDSLIVNMSRAIYSESVQAELQANPRKIFQRYEHYQRLVTP